MIKLFISVTSHALDPPSLCHKLSHLLGPLPLERDVLYGRPHNVLTQGRTVQRGAWVEPQTPSKSHPGFPLFTKLPPTSLFSLLSSLQPILLHQIPSSLSTLISFG